jgi:hypothetical protein
MLSRALTGLRDVMRSGHNRIVLVAALGGTGATAVPFLLLRCLADPIAAMLTSSAGLNTSMADSRGPYRRLLAMRLIRHAMRGAVVIPADTALLILLRPPHGFWIPLTTWIVLQPHFGATHRRTLHGAMGTWRAPWTRSSGTASETIFFSSDREVKRDIWHTVGKTRMRNDRTDFG